MVGKVSSEAALWRALSLKPHQNECFLYREEKEAAAKVNDCTGTGRNLEQDQPPYLEHQVKKSQHFVWSSSPRFSFVVLQGNFCAFHLHPHKDAVVLFDSINTQ